LAAAPKQQRTLQLSAAHSICAPAPVWRILATSYERIVGAYDWHDLCVRISSSAAKMPSPPR